MRTFGEPFSHLTAGGAVCVFYQLPLHLLPRGPFLPGLLQRAGRSAVNGDGSECAGVALRPASPDTESDH